MYSQSPAPVHAALASESDGPVQVQSAVSQVVSVDKPLHPSPPPQEPVAARNAVFSALQRSELVFQSHVLPSEVHEMLLPPCAPEKLKH